MKRQLIQIICPSCEPFGTQVSRPHRWPGPHPLHNVGFKKKLVETMNKVLWQTPARCRQPLNTVRPMVCYIVQCFHYDFLTPTFCTGGSRQPVWRYDIKTRRYYELLLFQGCCLLCFLRHTFRMTYGKTAFVYFFGTATTVAL